jgi:hypothetical protein
MEYRTLWGGVSVALRFYPERERERESRQKEAMGLKACMGLKAAIYFRCGFRNVPEREI